MNNYKNTDTNAPIIITRQDAKNYKEYTEDLKRKQKEEYDRRTEMMSKRYKGQYIVEKHIPIYHWIFLKPSQRRKMQPVVETPTIRRTTIKEMYEKQFEEETFSKKKRIRNLVKHYKIANFIGVTAIVLFITSSSIVYLSTTKIYTDIQNRFNRGSQVQPVKVQHNKDEYIIEKDVTPKKVTIIKNQKSTTKKTKPININNKNKNTKLYNKYVKDTKTVQTSKGVYPREVYNMSLVRK